MEKKSLICKIFGHKWHLSEGKPRAAHCDRCRRCMLDALPKLEEEEINRRFNEAFKYYDER